MKRKYTIAHKIRMLTNTLLLSALLNLVFVAIFFYLSLRETSKTFTFEYEPKHSAIKEVKLSNLAALKDLKKVPYETLLEKLQDKTSIESGYLTRDLALSVLVERDHFHLTKALQKKHLSARKLIDNDQSFLLFPGLHDEDFEKIEMFIRQEKWPFSSKGLFIHLKEKGVKESTLTQAFSVTPEFLMIESLFQEVTPKIPTSALLQLLTEGKWETLETFCKKQKECLDLSKEKRREFLLKYVQEKSKTAAILLLLKEPNYLIKELDDKNICLILDLLPKNAKKTKQFAALMNKSLRSDLVHKHARAALMESQKSEVKSQKSEVKS